MMSKRFLPFSSPAMALTLISVLVALLVLLDKTQAAPGPGDEAAVGSYLEYLQSLDRYGGGFQTR